MGQNKCDGDLTISRQNNPAAYVLYIKVLRQNTKCASHALNNFRLNTGTTK